jgi:type VI secretion system secreted protein Hcp
MAQKTFLKIDQIDGESQDSRHNKEIEVLNWSWTMGSSDSSTSPAGSGAAARITVLPFTFSHYVDAASPHIMKNCLQGVRIPKVILSITTSGTRNDIDYLKLTFEQAIFSTVMLSSPDINSRSVESVTMLYTKVQEDYIPIKANGNAGPAISFSYNFERTRSKST